MLWKSGASWAADMREAKARLPKREPLPFCWYGLPRPRKDRCGAWPRREGLLVVFQSLWRCEVLWLLLSLVSAGCPAKLEILDWDWARNRDASVRASVCHSRDPRRRDTYTRKTWCPFTYRLPGGMCC